MTQWRDSEEREDLTDDGDPSQSEAKAAERRASLYDDTLSEKKRKSPWISIAWGILFIIVIVGVISTLLTDSSKDRIAELAEMNREEKENSPLAQKIREVRKQSSVDDPQKVKRKSAEEQTRTEASEGHSPEHSESVLPSSSETSEPLPQTEQEYPPLEPQSEMGEVAQNSSLLSVDDRTDKEQDLPEVKQPALLEEVEEEVPTIPESTPEEPVRDEADLQAYQSLLNNSAAAEQLVLGELTTLTYRDWRIVQRTDSELWIDLIADWTTGSSPEVHLIWAVNREDGKVRPLSDAARTLDSTD